MSLIHPDSPLDLIDFQVGSPVLPRRSSISEIHFEQEYENLIDSELPIFEQKLQTASSTIGCHSRRNSVDVEDILINIDSDEYETDSLDGEKVEVDGFLDVCDGVNKENCNSETVLPVDNFEALLILKSLDDLLNATLEQSDTILDGNSNTYQQTEELVESDENTQQIIEECLEDLDNYLKAIEEDDNGSHTSSRSLSSDDQSFSRDESSLLDFAGSSIFEEYENSKVEFDEEAARTKLRKMEHNYSKFVSAGIVNRGYVDTENDSNLTLDGYLRRPSSACAVTSHPLSRKQPLRATTLAAVRKERPRLIPRRKSLNENNIPPHCTLSRTSGADANCNTPENWLTSTDVTRERHAHASGDCCTGTVIVEPLHRQSKASSSSASVVNEVPHAAVPKEEIRRTLRGTWLRSSMRRLQHLNLPSAESATVENSDGNRQTDLTRLEIPSNVRPVSAPSRLPPSRTSTGRSSRSRSRDSISHEPNGRARSSSASSQSRRRRSLSSSVTSLASSVESTLSRMPPSEVPRNGTTTHEATTNAGTRRYSFLISGILYGVLKQKAFTALEASRANEKVRRRAERDVKLVEERRLAALRDLNQIIEIFSPPTKVEAASDIFVTDQGPSAQGLTTVYNPTYKKIPKNNIQSDISHNVSVTDTDISENHDYSQNDFSRSIPVTEAEIPASDDYSQSNLRSVPDNPKTDYSQHDSVTEADISETVDYSLPNLSDSVSVTEADGTKSDNFSPTYKCFDQIIATSVDNFTKRSADVGSAGDLENKDTESNDQSGVKISDDLNDSGYVLKDFDNIPVMPTEDEDRFKPEK